jgi:hypothetical protein
MIMLPRPVYTGYGSSARNIKAVMSDEQKPEVRNQKTVHGVFPTYFLPPAGL